MHKTKLKIMILSTCFNVIILVQYFLLGGTMGIIANIINIIRNAVFIYNIKNDKPNSKYLLFAFCALSVILTAIFYSSPIDIFPCILSLVGVYAYWVNNTKTLRLCNVICSICYIAYAIPLKSYVIILAETFLIITTIIGYIKYETNKKTNYKVTSP